MTKLNYRVQRQNNLNDVYFEDVAGPGNGRHRYYVMKPDNPDEVLRTPSAPNTNVLLSVQFQEGARNAPGGKAGVLESDLLEIARSRLQFFQAGEYATRENACALTHIEEALMWLAKRADDRAERGVLGTMTK